MPEPHNKDTPDRKDNQVDYKDYGFLVHQWNPPWGSMEGGLLQKLIRPS